MDIQIRQAHKSDEGFLWQALFFAAQMAKDGAVSPDAAKDDPHLAGYVADWGRPSDIGVIAHSRDTPIGAVWSRLQTGEAHRGSYIDDQTPELSAAVLPAYRGRGVGTQLFEVYLDLAKDLFPAVVLNVREDNPAIALYQRVGFSEVGEMVNRTGKRSLVMLHRF